MKKILFVMDTLALGGSQKVLLNCLHIFKTRYKVELLLINESGVFLKDIPDGVTLYRIFPFHKQISTSDFCNYSISVCCKAILYKIIFRGFIYLKYIAMRANKLVSNGNYEYIIGFQEGPSNYVVANLNNSARKVGWLHSDINRLNNRQTRMEVGIYEKLNAVLCVSHAVKLNAIDKYPDIAEKLRVIYNPINVEDVKNKSKFENSFKFSPGHNFITIGRLSPEKNYLVLISRITPHLIANPNDSLHIIGDGPDKAKLIEHIAKSGIGHQVFLHGFQSNPYSYLNRCDVYISSSEYEGLPTTVIESMLLSKKILASDILANRELLEDYELAEFFSVEEQDSFTNALNTIISKPWKDINNNIEEKVSYTNFLENFELIVESAIKN